MLNFDCLKKDVGIFVYVYVYNVSRKIFLMLYSINWPNLIA